MMALMIALGLIGFNLFLWALCRAVSDWRDSLEDDVLSCDGCRHYLGGGQCRINLEKECADGGYEMWESEEHAPD